MTPGATIVEHLCLNCGLCCNGVIFRDVELQPGDDAARLKLLGLPVRAARPPGGPGKFTQPCAAFDGCRCGVYADRPQHCHAFECALFQAVREGRVKTTSALRLIRRTRQRADRVLHLLRALGDTAEDAALSVRFRRLSKRFQSGPPSAAAAGTFAELTLATHDLNLILSESFYPGGPDE